MTIETREYSVDPKEFRRAAIRTYTRKLWLINAPGFLFAAFFGWMATEYGMMWALVSALIIVEMIATPLVVAEVRVRRALTSPINRSPFVSRISEDSFEQLKDGERRALIHWSELHQIDLIPEGLRIWAHKGHWSLIPRSAFNSESDFESAIALVRASGKLSEPR